VVNDLGTSSSGDATNDRPADAVVKEITALGGVATANYDSVLDGARIIKTAIDSYGRVDVLVNNAGILRDVTLLKMTDKDWDLVIQVHLKGTFCVTKAAWPYFRQQKYGRIINVSSGSGLYGNFGQSNYAAAKVAIYGFSRGLAKEGENINVQVNVIAPVAATRMTEGLFKPEVVSRFVPEKVVPLVVVLGHETCKETSQVFEVGGGLVSHVRWQRTRGCFFGDGFQPEDVQRHWSDIVSFAQGEDYPVEPYDTISKYMSRREAFLASPKL
jgi:3-hydroxyacyl-CoA dehydrogenase/3a,7a,12a-trihydroxy-5b-cholest-24-enoyl-CoA hydratase